MVLENEIYLTTKCTEVSDNHYYKFMLFACVVMKTIPDSTLAAAENYSRRGGIEFRHYPVMVAEYSSNFFSSQRVFTLPARYSSSSITTCKNGIKVSMPST